MPGTESYRFCNCGWPDHMLIPQGSPHGLPYDLFVMVSDFKQDAVNVDFDEYVLRCPKINTFFQFMVSLSLYFQESGLQRLSLLLWLAG